MPDDGPSDNFFVRFKQKVDNHVASAFQSVLGIPNAVTRNLSSRGPEPLPKSQGNGGSTIDDGSILPRSPSSQLRQPTVFEVFSSMSPMQALFRAEEFTESIFQAMWMSFLIDSPYSPLRLRDMPQPVPKDLPADADPSLFGFEDAFEDLLMVTSGQALPDIVERHRVKKEWNELFPKGLPPILWIYQLTRQGLWDGWEPRPDVFEAPISERWRRWLLEQDDPFHERRSLPSPTQNPKDTDETPKTNDTQRKTHNYPAEEENRETEEDSYFSLVGNVRASGSRQIETGSKSTSSARELSSQGLPSGWRVVENVQERKDANGNVQVTKTITTFNDRNEEVAKQIERRSDYTWSASFSTGGAKKDQRQENEPDEKNSWFWK